MHLTILGSLGQRKMLHRLEDQLRELVKNSVLYVQVSYSHSILNDFWRNSMMQGSLCEMLTQLCVQSWRLR